MLYIILGNNIKQAQMMLSVAEFMNVKCKLIDLLDERLSIWLSNEELKLNDRLVKSTDIFYLNDCISEYPFIPNSDYGDNYRYFSDSYPALQQRKSQFLSVLSLISRKCKTINDFNVTKDLYSKIDVLSKLNRTGLNIADYCITSSLNLFKQSYLYNEKELLWSCVERDAPLKVINKKDVKNLLDRKNTIPYIFYKSEGGTQVRIWLLNGKPLIAALVTSPGIKKGVTALERYEYIYNLNFYEEDAKKIHKEFELDFVEIYGEINRDNQLIINGLDPIPVFTELDTKGKEWIAGKMLEYLSGVKSVLKPPKEGERSTVFLKVLLEKHIESENS